MLTGISVLGNFDFSDTKKDAEEIIKKHNLDDARIILCTSDGRGDVNHLFNSYV